MNLESFLAGLARRKLLLYVLISVVFPYAWFSSGLLAGGSDNSFPLGSASGSKYLSIMPSPYVTVDARKLPFAIPWGVVLRMWYYLHVPYSAHLIDEIYFSVGIFLCIVGIDSFLNLYVPVTYLRVLVISAFYVGNIYAATTLFSSGSYLLFSFLTLPLVVVFEIRFIRDGGFRMYLISVFSEMFLMSAGYITSPLIVTNLFIFTCFFIVEFIRRQYSVVVFIRFIAYALGVVVCAFYWLVPLLQFFTAESIRGHSAGLTANLFRLNSVSIFDALRLTGYSGLSGSFDGRSLYGWFLNYSFYGSWVSYVLSIVVGTGVAILIYRVSLNKDRHALSLLSLTLPVILLIIVSSSYNGVLGNVGASILTHLPLASAFRSVYQRFIFYLPLLFVVFIAVGWDSTTNYLGNLGEHQSRLARLKRWYFAVLALAITGITVLYCFPVLSGFIFGDSGNVVPNSFVLPSSYTSVAKIINSSSSSDIENVLYLPVVSGSEVALKFRNGSEYFGIQPLSRMIRLNSIVEDPANPKLSRVLRSLSMSQGGRGGVCSLISRMDIRFVVFQTAIDGSLLSHLGRNMARSSNDLGKFQAAMSGCLGGVYHTIDLTLFKVKHGFARPVIARTKGNIRLQLILKQVSSFSVKVTLPRRIGALNEVVLPFRYFTGWEFRGRAGLDIGGFVGWRNIKMPGRSLIFSNTKVKLDFILMFTTLLLGIIGFLGVATLEFRDRIRTRSRKLA